ncbi:MAG: DUF2341 domain-containing protein [Opitutaceae bacterium]|nr:DUF2341 domain-containing protein [Opitutaceae bacterium]
MIGNLSTNLRRPVLAGLLLLCGAASSAHAWWDSEWTARRSLTIDAAAAGVTLTAPLQTRAMLVRLHDGNFDFATARPDGADLRFLAADDQTVLPHRIERYDSTLNEAFVWVQVPELKPDAPAALWLYYGSTAEPPPAPVDPTKAVFDGDTVLAYHFAENGQPAQDASGMGNHAQTAGLPTTGSAIGGGLRLDGKTTVTIPTAQTLFWTEGATFTWSAWIKFGAPQPNAVFFSRHEGDKFFLLGADNGAPFVEVTQLGSTVRSAAGAAVPVGAWHHLAAVAAGETITLYIDGDEYSTLKAPVPALGGPAVIGGNGVGGLMNEGGLFTGELDELQIAKVARTPAEIRLAASLQGGSKVEAAVRLGAPEAPSSIFGFLKEGYIGVIIESLTVDGWVVIGLLGVMSALSWVVMIGKASYLNRAVKANTAFLKVWSHLSRDLTALESADGGLAAKLDDKGRGLLRHSPLYRVYHIGVEEIRHRMQADAQGSSSRILSARSIEAIRASMDGGLVRETEKLSAQMVLLTIGISGGPFLGLLGTVVGVMITFAAVAAAGEVNVNAIAPGIAAALAATVAGLVVAIPALFGYNYLLTRIKSTSNDLHVFIDEFVTKMAEFYAEESTVDSSQ